MKRNLWWILGVAIALAAAYYFSDIVAYLLIAWVFSMLGAPLMVFFQRRLRFRRWRIGPAGAAGLTLLVFFLILAGLFMLLVPTFVEQASHLASVDYNALGEKFRPLFTRLDVQLHDIGMLETSESLGTRTQVLLSGWFKPTLLGDFLGSLLSTAGSVLVAVASITFILFFFLKDDTLFLDILHAIVPNEREQQVRHAVKRSSSMLKGYFGGLAIQTAVFTTLVSLTLWILGVPNALLIGVMAGIFNIIPYVGPILGIVVGCFFTISHYIEADFALMIPPLTIVALTILGFHFLDSNIIGPYIMSSSVQAHPLEIFIVTLAAAKLGGAIGMVIGIPVYTVLRVIAQVFFSEFKLVQRLTGHLED
ncbi:MAG: AI-2E family transporter [Saprospirales bacterium]|jgi:predicted PurR-regulated permease PerM|nr:AI-2E family transporter [Saprospirales bacterium]MBK8922521.1 AI-2E family transporter [Saprospirales bacterium]